MECIHPYCPFGEGLATWEEVVTHPALKIQKKYHEPILDALTPVSALNGAIYEIPDNLINSAPFKRLLKLCPCLYAQIDTKVSPKAVVHLCEITLGQRIDSNNVYAAFSIQHPAIIDSPYSHAPIQPGAAGGDIMEQLCSEVLCNHGVPHMDTDDDNWPIWDSHRHLSLNAGKMTPLKLYGDILIPAAPHNIMVSVKSEAARERFVISGNRLESVGFGFFNDASEFWTENRMNLLKRWGFTAVYMPANTLDLIKKRLRKNNTINQAININGNLLYRPLEQFGDDIARVAGKLSMNL